MALEGRRGGARKTRAILRARWLQLGACVIASLSAHPAGGVRHGYFGQDGCARPKTFSKVDVQWTRIDSNT